MKRFQLSALSCLALVATTATATADIMTDFYGWEDGGTVIGTFGDNISATNQSDAVNSWLAVTEDPASGTPLAYVGWITGLNDGDVIDASFFGMGDGVDMSRVRIWAHYTTGEGDINSYGGSAGGNYTYSGSDWTLLENSWTFSGGDQSGGDHTGLVIEARLYTSDGQTVNTAYIDDLNISVTGDDLSGVQIFNPGIPCPADTYCYGDGSGTACPCGNSGGACAGCANSGGTGATLSVAGTPSLTADSIVLTADGLISNLPCLFFSGTNQVNTGNGVAFGDGLRCAGNAAVRIEVSAADVNGSCSSSVEVSTNGQAYGNTLSAGEVVNYQCWYRDNTGVCGNSHNLTNGLTLTWDA